MINLDTLKFIKIPLVLPVSKHTKFNLEIKIFLFKFQKNKIANCLYTFGKKIFFEIYLK